MFVDGIFEEYFSRIANCEKFSRVQYDQRYPDGIAKVMREARRYYKQEVGKTFQLNDPTVEVVTGDRGRSWCENTPNGPDRYWWSLFNMQQELLRKMSLRAPDLRASTAR